MQTLLILLITLFLSGCATLTPPMKEYTLQYPPASSISVPAKTMKTLKVVHPKSLPSLHSKAILYQRASGEINGYLYSRWSDTPSFMIERSLSLSLNQQSLFDSILPSTSTAQADYLLESELFAFHQQLDEENSRSDVVIDITCHLIDRQTKKVIASKRFSISKPSKSYDAKGGVDAFNAALEELNVQNSTWISSIMKGVTH